MNADDHKLGEQVQNERQPLPNNSQKKKRVFIGLVVIAILVTIGIVILWFVRRDNTAAPVVTKSNQDANNNSSLMKTSDEAWQRLGAPTTGETWFDKQKPIEPQGYFTNEYLEHYLNNGNTERDKAEEAFASLMPVYKEVGKRGDAAIIMATNSGYGIGMSSVYLFEKDASGQVTYMAHVNASQSEPQFDDAYIKEQFVPAKKITIDTTTRYDSLSFPSQVSLSNGEKIYFPKWGSVGDGDSDYSKASLTKIGSSGKSTVYRAESKNPDTELTSISFVWKNPLGLWVGLDYVPHTTSLAKYTWSNDKVAKDISGAGADGFASLASIARGCGQLVGSAVTQTSAYSIEQLSIVGKTDTGQVVYQPKDNQSPLVQKAYQEYKNYTQTLETKKALSLDEYLAEHALVLIENADKNMLVYVRTDLAPAYGCAKPVIYLYPTRQMSVNVKVGADVKISEPFYPAATGWNVIAHPEGDLLYDGFHYRSLFWEGPGIGRYPSIEQGTVVLRTHAESTMRRQLVEQGLNLAEVNDFMEYWIDKIPDTKYVRLTWFTTEQLDKLAPLKITPRPDTVKRVFLDMAGLERPITLPAQQLTSFERVGFTVVEWGGLATMAR